MKIIALSVIVAAALGAAACFALTANQTFAYQRYTTPGAHVPEPGTNLVGPHWTGNP